MPPKLNPLTELIPGRILSIRAALRKELWENRRELEAIRSAAQDPPGSLAQAAGLEFKPIRSGEFFGPPNGDWQQVWFRVEIPAPLAGETGRRYFFWDCHGETTVYLDGRPWAGLDVAHLYCRLPDRACALWLDTGTYQTCMWQHDAKNIDEFGLRFSGAWTACRHGLNWETYWDLHLLTDWLISLLARNNLSHMLRSWGPYPAPRTLHPVARKLLPMLDEACQAWESGGAASLAPVLKRIYAAFPAEAWQPRIDLVGHSHLDLVWMWPEAEGERKTIHTLATALRLLDEYPRYRFMGTSPHSLKMIAGCCPELDREIRSRIREGRWEATGGAWVEFDTLIPCGEALGRSLALGQRYFEKMRGSISTTVWLPDCFGFNGFLPQIMTLAGIRNFYTGKLAWGVVSQFPYDSFVWRSADGSQVLTHLGVPGGDGVPGVEFIADGGSASGGDSVAGLIESAEKYRELGAHGEILKTTGVGDGGGGATVEKIELLNRLGNLAQVPPVEWGTVEGFFERLGKVRDRLPVFEGELYLEFHRGTYTTQGEFKRRYRRLERALQVWEAARALAGGGPIPEHAWERLCFAQFHDSLPGSSIKLVYDQLGANLEELGDRALDQARAELGAGGGAAPLVFNPLAIARPAVVELASPAGAPGPLQQSGDTWLAAVRLAPLCVAPLEPIAPPAWEVSPRVLDNGVLRVEFDAQGQIIKAAGREGPWPLAGAPQFILHPDHPPRFDAWELDHVATRQRVAALDRMSLRVVERGPVRAILQGQTRLGRESRLEINYLLEAGSEMLRLELKLDWREEHRVLRFYLPTGLRGRLARYGAPYGSVQRPQTPGGPREEAMWEVPASRWAAVTDDLGRDGLAIVTEAKYGFACRDGELALTLLRAPSDPALADDGCRMPRRNCPLHSTERGAHAIRFALGRYRSSSASGQLSTPAQAEALYASAPAGAFRARPAPFRFTSELGSLVPCWVLPAREQPGYILRLNEALGASGSVALEFAAAPAAVSAVDFLERPLEDVNLVRLGLRSWRLDYRPYQIVSLLVKNSCLREY